MLPEARPAASTPGYQDHGAAVKKRHDRPVQATTQGQIDQLGVASGGSTVTAGPTPNGGSRVNDESAGRFHTASGSGPAIWWAGSLGRGSLLCRGGECPVRSDRPAEEAAPGPVGRNPPGLLDDRARDDTPRRERDLPVNAGFLLWRAAARP